MSESYVRNVIEAALLAAGTPLPVAELTRLFEDNPELVRGIVAEGADKAREVARQTLDEVRRTMHLRPD